MRFYLFPLSAAAALLCMLPGIALATPEETQDIQATTTTITPEETQETQEIQATTTTSTTTTAEETPAEDCTAAVPVYAPFGPAAKQRANEALNFLVWRRSAGIDHEITVFEAKGLTEVTLYAVRNAQLALKGKVVQNVGNFEYLDALMYQVSSMVLEMSKELKLPRGIVEVLKTICEYVISLDLPDSTLLDLGLPNEETVKVVVPDTVLIGHYGIEMPLIGYGTWDGSEISGRRELDNNLLLRGLVNATTAGVRMIDTAESHGNHRVIEKALRLGSVKRTDIFIVDKVSDDSSFGLESTRKVVLKQIKAMGVGYVDLVLLHHMIKDENRTKEAWTALEQLVDEGKVKSIGLSNFDGASLDWFMKSVVVKHPPAVLQNKFQPFYRMMMHNPNGEDLVKRAKEYGMVFMGHSMLRQWPFLLDPLTDPHIIAIANTHKVSGAQVILRWALQKNIAVIPRSVTKEHIVENANVGGDAFTLSVTEMTLMEGLEWMTAGFSKPCSPDIYGIGELKVPVGY